MAVAKSPGDPLKPIVARHMRFRQSAAYKDALRLIEPSAECREECEHYLDRAALGVRLNEFANHSRRSDSQHKRRLLSMASKLRAAESVHLLDDSLRDQLRAYRQWIENYANNMIVIRPGSRRLNPTVQIATQYAHELLSKFNCRGPGLTNEGRWQQLASILYGKQVPFHYLDQYRRGSGPRFADIDPPSLDNLIAIYR